MSKAKQLVITESVSELKHLLSNRSITIASRIRMLIAIKNNEGKGLSRRKLAKLLGVSDSSIQIWRALYERGGLSLLLEDKRIGFKPSIINKEEHEKIKEKLHNPTDRKSTRLNSSH